MFQFRLPTPNPWKPATCRRTKWTRRGSTPGAGMTCAREWQTSSRNPAPPIKVTPSSNLLAIEYDERGCIMKQEYFSPGNELYDWKSIFNPASYRAKVGEEKGVRFVIHPKENGHSLPHLHASYQELEVVLEIPTDRVISGNLPTAKQKIASRWVVDHADYLKERWNDLVDGVVCFA